MKTKVLCVPLLPDSGGCCPLSVQVVLTNQMTTRLSQKASAQLVPALGEDNTASNNSNSSSSSHKHRGETQHPCVSQNHFCAMGNPLLINTPQWSSCYITPRAPCAGESWGHCSTIRVLLYWSEGERHALLYKSPNKRETAVPFRITVGYITCACV